MTTVQLHWTGGATFEGTDSEQRAIRLAGPSEAGASPSDTLLLALAACASVEVATILAKQRVSLQAFDVVVEAEQRATHPRAFTHIRLHFEVSAPGLRQERLERAIDLAFNKYCPVRASLSEQIAVNWEARLV